MEGLFYYILKSGGLLILFYAGYQVLLRKETLFYFNRLFLLSGLVISFILPLLNISRTIDISLPQSPSNLESISNISHAPAANLVPFYTVFLVLYLIGILFLLYKLVRQGVYLHKLTQTGQRIKHANSIHIKTRTPIQPFSFFHIIIYNPDIHSNTELEAILAHEDVHARQLHSLDILLMEVVLALQWFNPIVWLYRIALKQNLEFLADTQNHQIKINKKEYQYTLLRQSIGNHPLSIINPFFNSFIKKRIVMINQHPSHKLKSLKSIFLIPFLALFLVSFNVRTEYKFNNVAMAPDSPTRLEFVIDKETTDAELLKIKSELAKEKFDLSYTTVRNDLGEISSISLEIIGNNTTKGEVSSRFNTASDNDTIDPTYIFINTETNTISIGNASNKMGDPKTTHVWISKNSDEPSEINVVENTSGKQLIIVNGNEISIDETEDKHKEKKKETYVLEENAAKDSSEILVRRQSSNSKKQILINTGSSTDHDIEILEKEGNGFFFIDTDDAREPLFYVDGKKIDPDKVKQIDPNTIASINVLKGPTAHKKYGGKAEAGIVEITLKKK